MWYKTIDENLSKWHKIIWVLLILKISKKILDIFTDTKTVHNFDKYS